MDWLGEVAASPSLPRGREGSRWARVILAPPPTDRGRPARACASGTAAGAATRPPRGTSDSAESRAARPNCGSGSASRGGRRRRVALAAATSKRSTTGSAAARAPAARPSSSRAARTIASALRAGRSSKPSRRRYGRGIVASAWHRPLASALRPRSKWLRWLPTTAVTRLMIFGNPWSSASDRAATRRGDLRRVDRRGTAAPTARGPFGACWIVSVGGDRRRRGRRSTERRPDRLVLISHGRPPTLSRRR